MEKMITGLALAALVANSQGETVNFDHERPGTLPPGWRDWLNPVASRFRTPSEMP